MVRRKSPFLHRLALIFGLRSSRQRIEKSRTRTKVQRNNNHIDHHRCSTTICLRIENDEEMRLLKKFFPEDRWIDEQSEHRRRLKALEFIRLFIEMNEREFFDHLITHEHLCYEKVSAIYQMIKIFLQRIYSNDNAIR